MSWSVGRAVLGGRFCIWLDPTYTGWMYCHWNLPGVQVRLETALSGANSGDSGPDGVKP